MPFVQIHTSRATSPAVRARLGRALANAYAEHMQISHRIVNVGFLPYARYDLVRYDGPADAPQEMTVVTCEIRSGRTPEMLETAGRAIMAACARELGIAESRVVVYFSEHAGQQIYRDGGRAPDWSPAERAPLRT
jgi:phenylpyruvate tautomerase PptA (4-oxalocrotonate tautomerase family)